MNVIKRRLFIFVAIVGSILMLLLFIVICSAVVVFHRFLPLVPFMPEMLGMEKPQNYLILFQNNMELRPGGGFIGSYATLSIDHARFENFSVHNVYDTDGQLHTHVEPYYIIGRYLQTNLFMRDSNFDVDFAKSAQSVMHMYTLETRYHVDGVVAIDFSYIQSIVKILSPLYLWQYNLTVTPDNFFLLTQSHVEKNSFSGSTQKQNFLASLADSMVTKARAHKIGFLFGAIKSTLAAISAKHVLFASGDPTIQHVLSESNLSSTLFDTRAESTNTINDFLGINEANIGVNKANYFLKRKIEHHVTIQNSGAVTEHLKIDYTNTSSKNTWPSGRYIAYVRIIVPHNTQLTSIAFNGKDQKIVPAITDFHIFEQPGFKPPGGLEVDRMEEEGKTVYGFIIIVDYHTTLSVDIQYTLSGYKKAISPTTYDLIIFKQPGMIDDPYIFSLSLPENYKYRSSNIAPTNTADLHTYVLLTTLDTDKHIVINVSK